MSIGTDYGCCGQAPGSRRIWQEMQFLQWRGLDADAAPCRGHSKRARSCRTSAGKLVRSRRARLRTSSSLRATRSSDLQALNNVRVVIQGGAVVVSR